MVKLGKGERLSLSKVGNNLTRLTVGLGWKARETSGEEFDLDASAFLTGSHGKVLKEEDFIFYGNKEHFSGAVYSEGDNRTGGDGSEDDEVIEVDLVKVPKEYAEISFTVTIYNADKRGQNFGQVSNAYIRVVDSNTGEELIRYDLSEEFSIETAIIAGRLYKHNGEWKFNAVGQGFSGGLAALCKHFGVDAESE